MDSFYCNENQKTWITEILGQQEEAEARLKDADFVWGCNDRWHEYGLAVINDNWIVKHFREAGIKFKGTKQAAHMVGALNFKCGVKL